MLICDRLAAGESLLSICKDDNMPARSVVHEWIVENRQGFADRYARARDVQADTLADEILQIANTPHIGTKSVSKATGLEITEGDMIEHRRLQVDARKWYLAKVAPKKYGDKLDLNHSGEIKVRKAASDMTDDELATIAAGKVGRNADA
jgi:hypothetical protein